MLKSWCVEELCVLALLRVGKAVGTDCIMQQCSVVDACRRGLQAVCRLKVPLISVYSAVICTA